MITTHSMEVFCAKHLATNSKSEGHIFDSNIARSCYTQYLVSGPFLIQGYAKFIMTSHGHDPLYGSLAHTTLSNQLQ